MSIYRDSKRIVGTNADRIGTDAISGRWKEVGRTTLGSAGDTISSSFPRFTSGTKTTSTMSTFFHSNGSITQHINDVQTGSPTNDASGTDYYNLNAGGSSVSVANRIYAEELYETGNKNRISYDITSKQKEHIFC